MKYYLAYGSNLNKEQMAFRCPDAKIAGTSELQNYQLVFRRGVLTIEPKEGSTVPVGIWKISESDEKALDRYEGYPKFYTKEWMQVTDRKTGKTRRCMVYIMTDGYPIQEPGASYFFTVYHGYKEFKFDLEPLKKAYADAKWGDDQ